MGRVRAEDAPTVANPMRRLVGAAPTLLGYLKLITDAYEEQCGPCLQLLMKGETWLVNWTILVLLLKDMKVRLFVFLVLCSESFSS